MTTVTQLPTCILPLAYYAVHMQGVFMTHQEYVWNADANKCVNSVMIHSRKSVEVIPSYTQHNQFLLRTDLPVSTNTATARRLHESEPTRIRWVIVHSQERIRLGRTFRLYADGSYADRQGRVGILCLLSQINGFWGRYTSVTVQSFNSVARIVEIGTFLVLSDLVDIPSQIQPYATDALQRNYGSFFRLQNE
jgi:hypothetical protein